MAISLLSGDFTGTGQSQSVSIYGCFNLSLSGFGSGTVAVERSFDDGATWMTVESFTSDAERIGKEPENKIVYRLSCTSYSSGTLSYRISR